jgi:hypothetical protein
VGVPLLKDVVYFNIFMLAVPVFIQVSLFLYLNNRQNKQNYFIKRFTFLLATYLFWSFAWILYESNGAYGLQFYFKNFQETFVTLVWGGRSLFYFFFSLLVCVSVLEFFLRIWERFLSHKNDCYYWAIVSILLLCVFIAMPYYLSSHGYSYMYWMPMNFLPYVSGAVIIYKLNNLSKNKQQIIILGGIILCLALAFIEWSYIQKFIWRTYSGHILPPYTRLSLVVGTYSIVLLMSILQIPKNNYINSLAEYSLGIYCFHMFSPLIMANYLFSLGISINLAVFMDRLIFSFFATFILKRIRI